MGRAAIPRFAPVLLLIAAAATVGYLVLQATLLGDGDKYVVHAKFEDAGGILKNYTVKVGNVAAGSVERISLDENDDVIVRMELDDDVGPIGRGATAHVRPVNLLGEKYVDLDPGDSGHPLPSGSTIAKERTGTPTELDDVLNALDPNTRAGLRILINEAGLGLAGRGADFNTLLEELPPALDEASRFLDDVAQENDALDRLIVQGDRVIASVSSRRDDFGELIESAGDALDTVASRRRELGATIRNAPGALAQLTATLGRLQVASDRLAPAARDLRAAVPALASTLAQTPRFAEDARSALDAVQEVSPRLRRLGRQSTPTLERLQPTATTLARFSGDLQPLIQAADEGRGLREFLDFMDGWAGVIENEDGLGHVFRLRLTFDEEFFTSAVQRYMEELQPGGRATRRRSSNASPQRSGEAGRRQPASPAVPRLEALERIPERIERLREQVEQLGQRLPEGLTGAADRTAAPPARDATQVLDYLLRP